MFVAQALIRQRANRKLQQKGRQQEMVRHGTVGRHKDCRDTSQLVCSNRNTAVRKREAVQQ